MLEISNVIRNHEGEIDALCEPDFGKDFRTQFDEIKDKIGVCPQTDLCLPYMTCEENLRLLAEIRGIPQEKVHEEIIMQLARVKAKIFENNINRMRIGGVAARQEKAFF